MFALFEVLVNENQHIFGMHLDVDARIFVFLSCIEGFKWIQIGITYPFLIGEKACNSLHCISFCQVGFIIMNTRPLIKMLTISLVFLIVVYCVLSSGFYLVSFEANPDAFYLLRNIGGGLLVLLVSNLILLTFALALRSFADESNGHNNSSE